MLRHFIAAAVIVAGIGACSARSHVLTRMERLTAEIGARDYAEKSSAEYVGCYATDSNADGFITCTVRLKQGDELAPLACNYAEGSPGCKRLPPGGAEPVVSR